MTQYVNIGIETPHLVNMNAAEDVAVVNQAGQLVVIVTFPSRRQFQLNGESAARVLDGFGLDDLAGEIRSGKPQKVIELANGSNLAHLRPPTNGNSGA